MSRGWAHWLLAVGRAAGLAALVSGAVAAGRPPEARMADAQQCADRYPATRDPSNPLDLRLAPVANPLDGASFFVDGARHGEAAGAISQLLGRDPTRYRDGYSWARFEASLQHGPFHRKLRRSRSLVRKVALLEKIAAQPEAQRFSLYSGDGGPGAIFAQVQKSFCRKADIRYEINRVSTLPHAVVYVEGGYSDASRPLYTARVLNAVGVRNIRGFYTNDTHMNWTANEIRWGMRVSALTGGSHFIVNTADNGHGPLLNRHPGRDGIADLCNPPGRGAGIPTTGTGNPTIDAFMWAHVPGTSSGRCNGGTPSGTFWLARALTEARNANARLGPRFPSRPY